LGEYEGQDFNKGLKEKRLCNGVKKKEGKMFSLVVETI
jgi:hypothetical protein